MQHAAHGGINKVIDGVTTIEEVAALHRVRPQLVRDRAFELARSTACRGARE